MLFALYVHSSGRAEVDAGRDDTPDDRSRVNVCVGEALDDRRYCER